jgi:predicted  nucleic acid-binding Zn-ribbon protein
MCCGGIRKAFLAAGLVLGLVAVLTCTKLGGYFRVGWHRAGEITSQWVTPETEIARLKLEIGGLTKEVDKNITLVANEQAAVDRLDREITNAKEALAKKRDTLMNMGKDLDSGETEFIYGGKVYTRKEVAQRFSIDWESFKSQEATLASRKEILTVRQAKLATAKEQLAAMKNQQETLQLEITKMENQLAKVRLEQTQSNFALDDGQLSKVKSDMADLQQRIEAERNKTELAKQYNPSKPNTINADAPAPRPVSEIVKEMREHFGDAKVSSEANK